MKVGELLRAKLPTEAWHQNRGMKCNEDVVDDGVMDVGVIDADVVCCRGGAWRGGW